MRRRTTFDRDFADLHGASELLEMEAAGPSAYRPAPAWRWNDPMPGATISTRLAVGALLLVLIVAVLAFCTLCCGVLIFLIFALFH